MLFTVGFTLEVLFDKSHWKNVLFELVGLIIVGHFGSLTVINCALVG